MLIKYSGNVRLQSASKELSHTASKLRLKQRTELYSDSAKALNQAVILNRSISVDLDIKVRSTNNIININNT